MGEDVNGKNGQQLKLEDNALNPEIQLQNGEHIFEEESFMVECKAANYLKVIIFDHDSEKESILRFPLAKLVSMPWVIHELELRLVDKHYGDIVLPL